MTLTADFELGTTGATIALADAGNATAWDSVVVNTNAGAVYDATTAGHGSKSLHITSTAVGSPCRTLLSWTTAWGTQTDHFGGFYIYPHVGFATDEIIQIFTGGLVGTLLASIGVNNSNQPYIGDSNSATRIHTTAVLTLDSWNRIDFHVVHGGTGASTLELRLFKGTNYNGTTADESISGSTFSSGTSSDTFRIGLLSNEPSMDFRIDGIQAAATAWTGPFGSGTSANYTIINGTGSQLVNVNAAGDDVDAFSTKTSVALTSTELTTLLGTPGVLVTPSGGSVYQRETLKHIVRSQSS